LHRRPHLSTFQHHFHRQLLCAPSWSSWA
jgi:hypothetical protein